MREIYEKKSKFWNCMIFFGIFACMYFFALLFCGCIFLHFLLIVFFFCCEFPRISSSLPHIPPKRFPFPIPTLIALKWTPQKHLPFIVSYLKPCQRQVVHRPPMGEWRWRRHWAGAISSWQHLPCPGLLSLQFAIVEVSHSGRFKI